MAMRLAETNKLASWRDKKSDDMLVSMHFGFWGKGERNSGRVHISDHQDMMLKDTDAMDFHQNIDSVEAQQTAQQELSSYIEESDALPPLMPPFAKTIEPRRGQSGPLPSFIFG